MNRSVTLFRNAVCALFFSVSVVSAIEIPLDHPGGGTISPDGQTQSVSVGYVDMDVIFAQHPMTKRLKEEFLAEVDKRKKEIATMQATANTMEQVIVSSRAIIAQEKSSLNILKLTLASGTTSASLTTSTTAPSSSAAVPSVALSSQSVTTAPSVSVSSQPAAAAHSVAVSSQSFATVDTMVAREKDIKDKEADLVIMQQNYDKQKIEIAKKIKQNKEELVALEKKNTDTVLADLYLIVQKMADDENIGVVFDKNSMLCGQTCKDLTSKVLDRLKGR
ncbi:MAG: hypothetical protein ABSH12_04210 [Endomicrobiales bacterium]|jgi:Skp family chaperone for outer membrane proteins